MMHVIKGEGYKNVNGCGKLIFIDYDSSFIVVALLLHLRFDNGV